MEAGQRGNGAPQTVAMVIAAVLGVAGFAVAGLAVRGAESPSRDETAAVRVTDTESPVTNADLLTLGVAEIPATPDSSDQPHSDRSSAPRYAQVIEPVLPEAGTATAQSAEATPEPRITAQPAPTSTRAPMVGVTPESDPRPAPVRRRIPLLGQVPVDTTTPKTLGGILSARGHADAAVVGSITALAANGSATLHVERLIAQRPGLRVGSDITIAQSLTFSDAPFGLTAQPGVAALAEGDHVLLLVRRVDSGWRVLPLRGTWRIDGASASADAGIRGISSAQPEAGNLDAEDIAIAAAWAHHYRGVPLASVVAEIREAAEHAGWVLG